MPNPQEHTWKPIIDSTAEDKCTVCGCTREYIKLGKGWYEYWYARSGIDFHDKRPECLDWDDNSLD